MSLVFTCRVCKTDRVRENGGEKMTKKKNLSAMSIRDLLDLYKDPEIDDETHAEIHRIVQARKGSDYPVGLAAKLQGRL